MTTSIAAIQRFLANQDPKVAGLTDPRSAVDALTGGEAFGQLLRTLVDAQVFSPDFGRPFAAAGVVAGIAPSRMLRSALNLSLEHLVQLIAEIVTAFAAVGHRDQDPVLWCAFADRLHCAEGLGSVRLRDHLTSGLANEGIRRDYAVLADRLAIENPHAVYPTSSYRECDGHVESTSDHQTVEAVMAFRTFATIKIVDHLLDPGSPELRNIYRPLGRCICLIDENVNASYREEIDAYFVHNGILLEPLVYRAMEADKGLATVERMLGDFKRLGVSRNEPVLIMGGGVLADTGGLACALYGRNTPYVMLATSIVSGIDAGPSPRTCCDGFGYKNLLGAYHPPVLSLTDRFFFGTLREGWLRHGIAEIIKMAIVKNEQLFRDLEEAGPELIATRFGTLECGEDNPVNSLSQRILGGAMRSYVEAEYDNLYETHQCRPHAYGHTWSPGFEIKAGLLHGHAVAIGMGFGAYLSLERGWITDDEFKRILGLLDQFGLSLWHDILLDEGTMRESHRKIIQKRGGNLVAPLPKGGIGQCGYLNDLTEAQLLEALRAYRKICETYPRGGCGIEPLCKDVGLEDPGTVTGPLLHH